ncbi:uncharacterized protein CANTADRAFT_51574 [Suhomyces tanzawaensis NRRL Y-17324]|uniref:Uncharacterized protein n=1 Tax=Suhomyces tanzawaensis NRRL Y-17324 TaxID=984487 RepID=A0A1E4SJA2_9ASCO|nr:uncharacterized protein CANTADRAFT_51574 [Suhomyces tanzawaensis NRRL Y-17324]ODV79517.1 hypothetical protein CANTADRAFT_51574 [Suhomyces tanzawaensis NRRL Y-17324]
MLFSKVTAHLVLAYCAFVNSAPIETLPTIALSQVGPNTTLVPISALSNNPILDDVFAALKDSGLAFVVIDTVLLSPQLLNLSIEGTIFVLKLGWINLTDLFIALQRSGLVIQILNVSLDDPEILPGLLRLGKSLLEENGIDIFNPDAGLIQPESVPPPAPVLAKRESQIYNDLLAALTDSGLAVAVVEHLLTTPSLADPSAHFLSEILKSKAISVRELLVALKESNLVFDLLKDILHDKELLRKFGWLVLDGIKKGLIPREMYDGIKSRFD